MSIHSTYGIILARTAAFQPATGSQKGNNMPAAAKHNNPRTASRATRRLQLIDATMKCIARKGMSSTTLGDVAREAGLSQGIVNLHFESKDNLLNETLRHLADDGPPSG
jgi:AcrR family transcriptional regulator